MKYRSALAFLFLSAPVLAQAPTFDDVAVGTVPLNAGGTTTLLTDIWKPAGVATPTPVVVWIHGGGWQGGSHNQVPASALALLDSGISIATVGYRLSGQAIFPAQIHDVKGVVRFLRANAATYGLDPDRIACWGSSAGGHLSALLATSGGVADTEGTSGGNPGFSSRVSAAVDYFGPTDLLQINLDVTNPPGSMLDHDAATSPESRLIGFDGPGEGIGVLRANQSNPAAPFPALIALITLANPNAHVSSDDPPVLVAHGTADTVVPLAQSQRLFDAARSAGLGPVYRPVPGAGHGALGPSSDAEARSFLLDVLVGNGDPVGTSFCFGDGSGTPCPCGNASAAGAYEGCLSSLGIGGRLRATGDASVANDTLVLRGTRMPDSPTLYFQGTNRAQNGAGAPFGDGLRCAVGSIVRLGIEQNVAGGSVHPAPGDAPISTRGANAAGQTRTYQAWYRNSASFCTGATFNLTNGAALTWIP